MKKYLRFLTNKHTLLTTIVTPFLVISLFSLQLHSKEVPVFDQQIGLQLSQKIVASYETNIEHLSIYRQTHWGVRRWRQTNHRDYEPFIYQDIQRVQSLLNSLAITIDSGDRVLNQYLEQKFYSYSQSKSIKKQRRAESVENQKIYLILGPIIAGLARLNEYGLTHQKQDLFFSFLKKHSYRKFVTDRKIVESWGAPISNHVFWLNQLGVEDLRNEFINFFKIIYPENRDPLLKDYEFKNKIYAMTHMVLADSYYYQNKPNKNQLSWITEYFDRNLNEILKRTTTDIVIEVGLCFLIMEHENNIQIDTVKNWVALRVNLQLGYIPSETGDPNFSVGEHRNAIAAMLLNWQPIEPRKINTALEAVLQSYQPN